MTLKTPLLEIRGIGPKFLDKLKHFKIETVKDLLWHFPFRYEDFSEVSKIIDLVVGQQATVQGVIQDIKVRKTWKRKLLLIEAIVEDETGKISAVWFNQRFLLAILKKGKLVSLAGKVAETKEGAISLSNPTYEFINQPTDYSLQATDEEKSVSDGQLTVDSLKHTGRIVPIYPETRGLTSKAFRYLIKPVLDDIKNIPDTLPNEVIKKYKILEINKAIHQMHFPEKIEDSREAKKRFAFEGLFYIQVVNLRERLRLSKQKANKISVDLKYVKKLLEKLPFELTHAQKKVLWDVLKDIGDSHPMNRLIQGDVGSGKTIVAVISAMIVAEGNKSSAIMAPTEILANQHYQTFKKFFPDFNKGVGILTSSGAKIFYGDGLENIVKKPEFIKKISTGDVKIVFGTHSLIQKNVIFNNLALVVIDEQHRFGVKQRAQLISRESEFSAHFLSMSATPIPRTLTLTVFGDLDLSIVDELPRGRKEIITKIVAPENRDKAYAFIRGQVKKGRQVFVICPRIEPSQIEDVDPNTFFSEWQKWELKSVKEEYAKLSEKVFPDLKVEMLHGKLKVKEKEQIMEKFKNKEIDILVSTSVVEVGVDIPNATIMIIESAERFGLAQLYQFRGRVGRGEHQSFCLLFTEFKSQIIMKRLRSLVEAKNGFELAEEDLKIRGPGEFLGQSDSVAQTGIPDLAMKALQNPNLVMEARKAAEEIIKKDPELKNSPILLEQLEGFKKQVHLE
ncbi:ATP-dependent DNA helicase RecG [Candidatus Wolfebacteria bacterium CG10_big_fil_rev_8_21_14_0_10_31_9]|uniref:ATP-dependent DNA helicase RecG n=1 Tax=Candidatus Wolfebacteria bacterium CG10_big_fil_rev_8_21_14_0_10_31_9 TaxID=1975070 RepID=A0A2H0RCJ0_9BACT|nr:MAG: ATP-dependent DNA helicase RecG [Candidatus Wolfebacteria bacterium CG10_big_fil_rev_8_21_14_0_10_31_9]